MNPRIALYLAAWAMVALAAAWADSPAERFAAAPSLLESVPTVDAAGAYSPGSFTVELWARLESKDHYNILIANETKGSTAHWEIFTEPGSGLLCAYLPAFEPDHVRSNISLVDGGWRFVALVVDAGAGSLWVDGREVGRTAMEPKGDVVSAGQPLMVGSLVERHLSCGGQAAEVRVSSGARDVSRVPDAWLAADDRTLGLWRFTELHEAGRYADLSGNGREARLVPALAFDRVDVTRLTTEQAGELAKLQYQAGGRSLAILPPEVDVRWTRALLGQALAKLKLAARIDAETVREAVLRDWEEHLHRIGLRLSGQEPLPPGGAEYALDRQALVDASDGDAFGVVLRRTEALLARIRGLPGAPDLAAYGADLERLRAAEQRTPVGNADARRGLALATLALQREIAFANPLLDFDRILFVARGNHQGSRFTGPTTTADVWGQHFATQYYAFSSIPGGGLFRVEDYKTSPRVTNILADSVVSNGRLAGRKLEPGAFLSPDLSFDGKEIVFAYTENRENRWIWSQETTWNLFRVGVDGAGLTQLTDSAHNDFDPCWLPNGRIAFISERRGGYIRCFAVLPVPNYVLHSMKPDGSDIYPLSYYETSEWHPSVDNDGMLVYTRWDYTDRENCLGSNFWICAPDGRNPRAPHGNYPYPWHTFADNTYPDTRFQRPYVELSIRAIPGSHRYVATAAPHHGEAFGALITIDLREPDDGAMSQIRKITPYVPFPETQVPARSQYEYGAPWPLSEDFHLCNRWENLYLVDRFGNEVLLLENALVFGGEMNADMRLIDPIPLRPRPVPPLVPTQTNQGEDADPNAPPATIALLNVYQSDIPFPPGAKVKWLRVTQNILKENPIMGVPMIGYQNEATPRIPLGIVPVEEDGSAHLEAPVERELIFQPLDENYMAIQSMRSVAYVHPGERLTCIGCHEGPDATPATGETPLALRRAPSRLEPEVGPIEPISYHRTVKPVFARACMPCHQESGAEPLDWNYEALEPYAFHFDGGMSGTTTKPDHGGSRSIPGRVGARCSRMGQALLDETHRGRIADEDYRKIVLWLDSNSLRLTAFHDEEAQLRGELVWPRLDVDLSNPQGLERP